ncbi:hypothetical protein [Halococcus agarilyticus]|uniref:hypothetical protein n=1 Tax=Halococcus agarilyticus TaxID=1232219 RepID=UPI00067775C3|nr:hypothetical protein [Halococcus agarilyticus]
MQRNDGDSTGDSGQHRGSLSVDRRSYLKLAGTAAGAAGLFSGTAAAFERRGIRFKRTVDMVADAGCDPTGEEPCGAKIRAAADDYTLLKFPPGEYLVTKTTYIENKTNLGFLGEGDARFRVPTNFNEKALVVDDGTGLLFEGIDIDQRADGATPALHLGTDDDLRVHDVELLGQGIHPKSIPKGEPGYSPGPGAENGNPHALDFFYPIVRSADGTGLVTDVVANNHGLMGTYNAGNGRSGIWVGIQHKGTITFRRCRIEEFGSNGTYTSRTNGVVQFEDGVHRNNDNNQLRIGSPGSYAEGMILSVDADESGSPNPYEALNYRGARIEMGRMNDRTDVAIRDCNISIRSTPHSGGGVVAESTASEFRVENTRIGIEADGVRGILGKEPDGGGNYSPPAEPHTATIRNTSVTGSANGNAAIELENRPKSVVDTCCIHHEGDSRNGVHLDGSDNCTVRDSTIDVTGEPVVRDGTEGVSVSSIDTGGSCPAPVYGAGDYLPHKLSIESNGGRFSYEFIVSGDLGKSTANNATIDDKDVVSGNTATGQGGGGGIDSYGFSGDIVAFDFDGDATVYLDGEEVDPGNFGNVLTIKENGGSWITYGFSVSGDIVPRRNVGGADEISADRGRATGGVRSGYDSYYFSGDISNIALSGDATLHLNNEVTTAEQYLPDVLTIEGSGSWSTYEFTASGGVAPRAGLGGADEIDTETGHVTGGVAGGSDSYHIAGELTDVSVEGTADVYRNGERLDVGGGGAEKHSLTIAENDGAWTTYGFSVNGSISPRNNIGGADEISADGQRATGGVIDGSDGYTITGEITSLSLSGDATVYLDGEALNVEEYLPDVLTVEGSGSWSTYEFTATGGVAPRKYIGDADEIDASTDHVAGGVASGSDSYYIAGELTDVSLDDGLTVYRNGNRVNP